MKEVVDAPDRFHRVLVFCRVCPKKHPGYDTVGSQTLAGSSTIGSTTCFPEVDANGGTLTLKRGDAYPERRYGFDGVFSPDATQADVFQRVGAALVDDVLSGFNGTILAYGQTGTGKTHTMAGPALAGLLDGGHSAALGDLPGSEPVAPSMDASAAAADSAGIIPRAIARIFSVAAADAMQAVPSDGSLICSTPAKGRGTSTTVSVSAVQLYCEAVHDLLTASDASVSDSLPIREDPETGVHVEGVTWVQVGTPAAALRVVAQAARNRATAATLMNASSSRSHAVFMFRLERRTGAVGMRASTAGSPDTSAGTRRPSSSTSNVARVYRSSLFLVDLAGSERVGRSGASGDRLDEARAINLSLSALGNCIAALASRSTGTGIGAGMLRLKNGARAPPSALSQVHVPYRDSKLTRLLQDSLGGNARTALLITVSPEMASAGESGSTLEFGARAAQVAVHARRNETLDYKALYTALLKGPRSDLESDAGAAMGKVVMEAEVDRMRQSVAALEGQNEALQCRVRELEGQLSGQRVLPAAEPVPTQPITKDKDSGKPPLGGPSITLPAACRLPSPTSTPAASPAASPRSAPYVEGKEDDARAADDACAIVAGMLASLSPGQHGREDRAATPTPTLSGLVAPLTHLHSLLDTHRDGLLSVRKAHAAALVAVAGSARAEVQRLSGEREAARASLVSAQGEILSMLVSLRTATSRAADSEVEARHARARLSTALDELVCVRAEAGEAAVRAVQAESEAEAMREKLRQAVPGNMSWADLSGLYESSLRALQARVDALEARSASETALGQEMAFALREAAIRVEGGWQGEGEEGEGEERQGQGHKAGPADVGPVSRPSTTPSNVLRPGLVLSGANAHSRPLPLPVSSAQLARANAALLGLPLGSAGKLSVTGVAGRAGRRT